MKIAISMSIFSFLLQGFLSNYQGYTLISPSLFSTIYGLVTLVVISKYFSSYPKMLCFSFILGMCYDIAYTGSFPINACLFSLIMFLSVKLHEIFADTIVDNVLISIICVGLYHVCLYIIFLLVDFNQYSISLLGSILWHSLLMTGGYSLINYVVVEYFFRKYDIHSIR